MKNQKPSISTVTERFSTRTDAETYLAENDLGGVKKPMRVGGKWYLVQNREGTINRSLFAAMLRETYRRRAKAEKWRDSELAMTLADVPREAARMWRELVRANNGGKVKVGK